MNPKIVCFGEVLWDIFPTHKMIGGAPFNVALRLKSLGVNASIITKVGNDDLGREILRYTEKHELPSKTIQVDGHYKTGEVQVILDNNGNASYLISQPVAWDFIEYFDHIADQIKKSDAIIFGSLSSRNNTSRDTLFRLLDKATFKILDINLRPPFYTKELLLALMKKSDFIKLNDEELEEVCISFEIDSKKTLEEKVKVLAEYTKTDQICVTKGKNGALLFFNETFYHNSGYKVKVIDTVGAGDSFLATLILKLLEDQVLPQKAIDFACAVGAMVAGSKGANPTFTEKQIEMFISSQ